MNPTLDFENEKTANDRFLGPHHETMTVVPVVTNNERKCCRICFDEEEEEEEEEDAASDNDSMIAPCMCKGSSKWVHRTCLDRWRMNEPDRAFAQCTECRYTYHLIASHTNPRPHPSVSNHPSSQLPQPTLQQQQLPSSSSFWNQPRIKFCFFVSRDVCTITLLMQLLIIGFAYIIMRLDKNQHWDLTHLILQNPYSSGCYKSSTFWCRHNEAAVYYLFGIIALLVIAGILGSIIFCRNGCSFRKYDTVDSSYVQYHDDDDCADKTHNDSMATNITKMGPYNTAIPAVNISDVERGTKAPNELGSSYQQRSTVHPNQMRYQRRSTEYYRRQRLRMSHNNSNNSCGDTCCCISYGNPNSRTSSSRCSDRCTTTNHFCLYTNSCPCDDPHSSCCDGDYMDNGSSSGAGDCCCCCCNCLDHHHHASSASTTSMDSCNCGDGDNPLVILLFILLVFFVIMAMIGLFLLLVIGVIVCQRIVQRHIFLLQKQTLVQEFQVADLSSYHKSYHNSGNIPQTNDCVHTTPNNCTDPLVPLVDTLHPNDVQRLQKLGLLNVERG